MKTYNKRKLYFDNIKPFIDKDLIKVLVGQRRVGKSYILFQIMDELQTTYGVQEDQIVYINKERHAFAFIQDYEDLLQYVKDQSGNQKTYVFIDEVQDIQNFEKALRDMQASQNYDIYISWSNAHLLSGELATLLTGRYIEFTIYPLNYQEFLQFHKIPKWKESFFQYIRFGGLPYLKHLELDPEIVHDYVYSIYNTILLKDIVHRYHVRNIDFLDKLLFYLSDNIGSLFSAHNITKYLKSQKISFSPNVVLEYLKYSTSVFLINKVRRQDIIGKKVFEINDKYYFSDLGIRNVLVWWYKQTDIANILENVVYLHFVSLGYTVHVGNYKNKEIDFVVQKQGDIKYVQVVYLLNDQQTIEREFGNLLEIPDNYEKIVLSLDDFVSGDYQGVKHYNLIDYISL